MKNKNDLRDLLKNNINVASSFPGNLISYNAKGLCF